ncbi:type II secretion system protein E [Coriobacterium glomerans PW2]|uniref:Type II secretion system protein E n=1 Tax=Coriobacterium glomerans (strain ATCC 49209 / DSM 20642 / JCM 10262 / PW2) TaxID=700015 RepID=F2NA64_CORGP|nr:ATPase, T2SS/T4P/T4SS family [Coriobacterium glomerans]AEB06458.1 type II secretion system protein E [Coriobacterium glomerans PW2]
MSVLERVEAHSGERRRPVSLGLPARRRSEIKAQAKRDMMERVGFAEVARIAASTDAARSREELRPAVEAVLNIVDHAELVEDDRAAIIAEILDDVVGLGPLQTLLEDDSVSEIMVNGCSSVFFERAGVIHPLHGLFETDEQIRILIDRIISPLGRRVDERSPIVNARLPSGYRVNAVIPPVAIDGPALTIRKFSDRITSLTELMNLGSLPQWYARMLSWAVSLRQDLAVAGGTGSGKTTLLNALSCEIPIGERIVTIEDSAELKFGRHPDVVRLEARSASIEGEGAVTIRDLVTNALRMRPDRIVVGEVRGAEAIDMLQAMNTGHDGSLTTLHAGTEEETVVRLTLLARYGINLPSDLIEEQIAMALDGIVMSEREPNGRRFVASYSGVERGADGGVELERYVSFDRATASWELVREPPFLAEAVRSGAIEEEEVASWRRSCPASSAC